MTSRERGLIKPRRGSEHGYSIAVPQSTAYLEGTNGVFSPTRKVADMFTSISPLNDRTHTPRGAERAISIGRLRSNRKWLYNKNTLDPFLPTLSTVDIARGKHLRRITRREDKQKALALRRSLSAKVKPAEEQTV